MTDFFVFREMTGAIGFEDGVAEGVNREAAAEELTSGNFFIRNSQDIKPKREYLAKRLCRRRFYKEWHFYYWIVWNWRKKSAIRIDAKRK